MGLSVKLVGPSSISRVFVNGKLLWLRKEFKYHCYINPRHIAIDGVVMIEFEDNDKVTFVDDAAASDSDSDLFIPTQD